ncbi:MAG: hypothetical protein ABJI69_03545 [Balneola sp.]
MMPDFSSYSYDQLVDSFRNINQKLYPENVSRLISELEKKKPDNIGLIHVNSGFRLLDKDQIPKKIDNYNEVSFSYSTGSKEFNSNFLKVYIATVIPLIIVVLIRINMSDIAFKDELLIGLPILILFSIVFSFLYRGRSDKTIRITFKNSFIEELRGKKRKEFYLNELRSIEVKEAKKDSVDLINLYFEEKRKLVFSSFEPNYSEIKSFLEEYLSQRMNYEKYLSSGSNL